MQLTQRGQGEGEFLYTLPQIRKDLIENVTYSPLKIDLYSVSQISLKRRNSKQHLGYVFWVNLQKPFCRFLTPKVNSGTDMINPSIESSDFLFWYKKIWSRIFENFMKSRQIKFHEFKFSVCSHTLNFKIWNLVCLFLTKFSKLKLKIFLMPKQKIRDFDWWVDHIYVTFNFWCEKAAKRFLWIDSSALSALLHFAWRKAIE